MVLPSPGALGALTLESLVAHRELFRSFAANLPRGSLHIFDRDLRFLFAGGPALAEHGFDASALEGRTLAETVPAALAELLTGYYLRALGGERVEFDHTTLTGVVFHTCIRPIHGDDGSVIAGLLVSEDVSQARRVSAQLEISAAHLRDAQRLAGLGTFRCDLATGHFELNEELKVLWGLPPEWTDGAALRHQVHPDDLEATQDAWQLVTRTSGRLSYEHRILRATDGDTRHLRVELEGELGADGSLIAVRGTQLDVTDLVRARLELAQAQQLSRAVLAASPDLTLLVDLKRQRVLWSSGDSGDLGSWAGQASSEAGEWDPLEQLHPDDLADAHGALEQVRLAHDAETLSVRLRVRASNREADDDWRWLSVRVTPFRRDDTGVEQVVCVVRDVHDVVEAENRLHHAAHHDALTGLPNRTLLLRTLDAQLTDTSSWGGALLYVDLDRFKRVNDQFGHAAGDSVLVAVAQRLQSVLRAEDMCARVGGDEFVVLLAATTRDDPRHRPLQEQALLLAERLRTVAAEPVEFAGHTHNLSASVGIRLAAPGLTAQDALRDADSAMYVAKKQGRDRGVLFESSQRRASERQAMTEQLLRQSLGDEPTLDVAYQPIFDIRSGQLLSVEALARLNPPAGGPVDPEHFIGVAEHTGLIGRLGEVILTRACDDLHAWRQATPAAAGLHVAVNLSARQAQDPGLADMVLQTLLSRGLRPTDLVLELTETVLLSAGLPALRQLRRLRDAGTGIAIDDFGVGYASLRYLATLPVTSLKVDRSFTAGLPHDAVSCTIVRAVAGLAADMELTCVIEGIENQTQLQALPAGVQGQGFHLGRPGPAHTVLALLQSPGPMV